MLSYSQTAISRGKHSVINPELNHTDSKEPSTIVAIVSMGISGKQGLALVGGMEEVAVDDGAHVKAGRGGRGQASRQAGGGEGLLH